jgi:hypothetical protein
MKQFCLILCLFLPAYSYAFPGPEVCEGSARAVVESNVHAYISLAEENPNDPIWAPFLSCKGQPVKLDSAKSDGEWMGYPIYSYTYSVQCASSTVTYSYSYILQRTCVLRGE